MERQMHIDETMRRAMKDRLPELIISEDLFRDGRERARFSTERGGMFRCPICGAKVALYRPRSDAHNPWNMNGFGRCPHFGRGGQYHGDTVGLYAAIHGIDEGEAFVRLARQSRSSRPSAVEVEARRKAVEVAGERDEARSMENAAYCLSTAAWGSEMGIGGRRLLASRGIHIEALPPQVGESVGYVDGDGFRSRSDGRYKLSGIVFRLGGGHDIGVQVRCSRGGRFVPKGSKAMRFMSYGQARPFNAPVLSSSPVVFIAEGPFDALSMVQCGADAVAAMGAGNHGYIEECVFRNPERPVVFVAYDDDEAGVNGSRSLCASLSAIPGLQVFRYPASGSSHDFNDLLCADRAQAQSRIALAKGLATCLREGILDRSVVEEMMARVAEHDARGDGDGFVDRALARLRRFYRDAERRTS